MTLPFGLVLLVEYVVEAACLSLGNACEHICLLEILQGKFLWGIKNLM
jgi:hypothetical protein